MTQKITETNEFERAAKNKKALNAYKLVIRNIPDLDEESRRFLTAILDKTNNLTKNVAISLKRYPELGKKIHDAVSKLYSGKDSNTANRYLEQKKVNGAIASQSFIGNPKKLEGSDTLDPNSFRDWSSKEDLPRYKTFPIIWFATNTLKGEERPMIDTTLLKLKDLDHYKTRLGTKIIKNGVSTWDRIKERYEL